MRAAPSGDETASAPPNPPRRLDARAACDPDCDDRTLWRIALERPDLRRWLVANPRADAGLLEFIAQTGGPGVTQALLVLLETLDEARSASPERPRTPACGSPAIRRTSDAPR